MVNAGLVDTIKELVIKVLKQTRGYKKNFKYLEALKPLMRQLHSSTTGVYMCRKGRKFDMQYQRKNHLET
jgi:hypothetical protein